MKTKAADKLVFPLTNSEFLYVLSNSFQSFVESGTSRSTAKLKPLHGAIAKDLALRLGDAYSIQSQGWGDDREGDIAGRYVDKKVDITVYHTDKTTGQRKAIAGIAVKFVMQNYSQNSNNYFENMLGETANIRANNCPYFQVFIILDRLPYYKKESKRITKWETFTEHNADKYITLSCDNVDMYFHTPNKTLLYVVHIPDNDQLLGKTAQEYMDFYAKNDSLISLSSHSYVGFGNSIVLNDYESFISKVYHTIKAI